MDNVHCPSTEEVRCDATANWIEFAFSYPRGPLALSCKLCLLRIASSLPPLVPPICHIKRMLCRHHHHDHCDHNSYPDRFIGQPGSMEYWSGTASLYLNSRLSATIPAIFINCTWSRGLKLISVWCKQIEIFHIHAINLLTEPAAMRWRASLQLK